MNDSAITRVLMAADALEAIGLQHEAREVRDLMRSGWHSREALKLLASVNDSLDRVIRVLAVLAPLKCAAVASAQRAVSDAIDDAASVAGKP